MSSDRMSSDRMSGDLRPAQPRPHTSLGAPEQADPSRWDRRLAVVVLVIASGAFFSTFDFSNDPGSPIARALWALIYPLAALRLLDGALRHRMQVRVPAVLVGFTALTLVSVAWSVGPALSLQRSIGLIGTVLTGLWLAQRLRPTEILNALRQALLIVALSSLLLYASGSSLAIDASHGTLQGVVSTKNGLGRLMALGILAAATTALLDRQRARRCTLSALPMVIALALTDSTGGTLVAAGVMACMAAALLWRARAGQVLLLSAVALSLSALVVLVPVASVQGVTGLVGEDATLTGRTEIWTTSFQALGDRPVLGYGYGAFWDVAEEAGRIRSRIGWQAPNAHNGLIDVGLELGLVGVVLAALVLASLVVQGLRDVRSGFVPGAFFRLPIACLLIVSTLVESGLLNQNSLLTLMLVAALATRRPGRRSWVDQVLDPVTPDERPAHVLAGPATSARVPVSPGRPAARPSA